MATRSRVLDRNQVLIERLEGSTVRGVASAYNAARRELTEKLVQYWASIEAGEKNLTPGRTLELVRQRQLLSGVNARLSELEREYGTYVRGAIESSSELALAQVEREMAILPREARQALRPFTKIDQEMVERFLPIALEDARSAIGFTGATFGRELQVGILQGESFPKLVKRLMGVGDGPAVWPRGKTSAELATRRLVIHANNAARVEYVRQAETDIPKLQKQAVAVIQGDTTDCCLRVHGQVQPIDEPFELKGTPRFAAEMQHTPFHWNCRTAIAAWHPSFERGGLTTANMRSSAAAELRRR